MPTYTYTGKDILSPAVLEQALKSQGLAPATFTYSSSGDVSITVDAGTIIQVETAVDAAVVGSLGANKAVKLAEITKKSAALIDGGMPAFNTSVVVPCDKASADGYYTDYAYFMAHPARISAALPYFVPGVNTSEVASTVTAADILALAEACEDRLSYVYRATLNADGSSGELYYIEEVTTATDQAAVDLIIDTRT